MVELQGPRLLFRKLGVLEPWTPARHHQARGMGQMAADSLRAQVAGAALSGQRVLEGL